MGYAYVTSMVVADLAALTVYRFSGGFNVFHALAVMNLDFTGLALRPLLMKPRLPDWKIRHYMWITWSYVGLCAAGATEFLLRVSHVHWTIATGGGTGGVMLIGGFLISRFAPRPRQAHL